MHKRNLAFKRTSSTPDIRFSMKTQSEKSTKGSKVFAGFGANIFETEQMETDRFTPLYEKERIVAENCRMLCRECNRRKSAK